MNKNYIKVVLLGDGRVGKTSLLNKYITNKFNDKEDMTINSCYLEKELEINGIKWTSCIWDTAGQEKFNALTPIYYRDAKGAILVYDASNPETFTKVKKWAEELNNFSKDGIKIVVAGNKVDKGVEIDKSEILDYCHSINANHFFTSAKTGDNVNEMFFTLTEECVKSMPSVKNISLTLSPVFALVKK